MKYAVVLKAKFTRSNLISLSKGPVNDYSSGIKYVISAERLPVVSRFGLPRHQSKVTNAGYYNAHVILMLWVGTL